MLTRTLLTIIVGMAFVSPQGWGATNAQPHQVSRIYWELLPATEILVPLQPREPDGAPVRFHLVFHAFYPGKADRDWQTGLPAWPRGAPARLAVTVQAFPLTFAIPELAIRFTIDGKLYDLTMPGRHYRNVPCSFASDTCTPTGVEADLDPDVLRALVRASKVEGAALGTRFVLTNTDRDALRKFARQVGM